MKKGFSLLEMTVILAIFITIVGVAYYKYLSDRRVELKQASRVDKQQAMRRFLLWFRQDMQSMHELTRFSIINSFDPVLDSRLIELGFTRFVSESETEKITYKFDFNRRVLSRLNENGSDQKIDNIVNIQLIPFDFGKDRITNNQGLENLWYFDCKILFSDSLQADEQAHSLSHTQEFWLRIYPRLKSAQNKAGFNQFRLNARFPSN